MATQEDEAIRSARMSLATLAFKDRLVEVYRREAARSEKHRRYCESMAEKYEAAAPAREAKRREVLERLQPSACDPMNDPSSTLEGGS